MTILPADDLACTLRARRAPGLLPDEVAGEFVLPDYDGRSLANVPASLARLLGASTQGMAPPLDDAYLAGLDDGVERVVWVLLDALGWMRFRRVIAEEPEGLWSHLAARGRLLPMTSVFPSTTNTALATLLTGTPPIAHGLLGYELWLREYGVLAEMLALKPALGAGRETLLDWGLDPDRLLPVRGLGQVLADAGVAAQALLSAHIASSGLTRATYRGFRRVMGYTALGDMWAQAAATLNRGDGGPPLTFLYWGGIDSTIHAHGAAGGLWRAQLHAAGLALRHLFLDRLSRRARRGTLLLLMADHGFVDTPPALAHDTDHDAALRALLAIPYSGESRAAYLHALDGPTAREHAQQALGEDYVVLETAQARRAGLWGRGAPSPEAKSRLGHLLAIARGRRYLDRQQKRKRLRGRHGGLSPEEMLVPLLAVRLDDWRPG